LILPSSTQVTTSLLNPEVIKFIDDNKYLTSFKFKIGYIEFEEHPKTPIENNNVFTQAQCYDLTSTQLVNVGFNISF
jgi:hypothetical protein